MSIFNGKNISLEIFGESHSESIGVKAKGFPKMQVDNDKLLKFLERRKASSGVYSTSRKEPDQPIFENLSNGQVQGEFTATIKNLNTKSNDYTDLIAKPRPSHADYAWYLKDNVVDFTGGGRFSGRLTAPLCIAGGIAKQYLESLGIYVHAYIKSIGNVKGKSYKDTFITQSQLETLLSSNDFPALDNSQNMLQEIANAKADKDSVGGVVECIVFGMKPAIGDNLFGGLEGKIANLVYSIPAVKGVEFGDGFDLAKTRGSIANDPITIDNGQIKLEKNSSGGINGGISNGENITLSVAFRPTPSIAKEQKTVDLINKQNTTIEIKGRHDACIVVRAVPCVESAVCLAILDEIL